MLRASVPSELLLLNNVSNKTFQKERLGATLLAIEVRKSLAAMRRCNPPNDVTVSALSSSPTFIFLQIMIIFPNPSLVAIIYIRTTIELDSSERLNSFHI